MLWLTKDVSIRLLARAAGRTWVRCCSCRTVRNSESLRGLRCTLQERWGRGKARALLDPLAVRTYRTGVKALSCQSRADESEGFVVSKPCGRADKSEGFVGSKPCGRSDGNEGFVGSKPCGRADGNEGFVGSKPCGRADKSKGFVGSKPCGRERRLCRVKAVRTSGQERRLCRVKAVRTSGHARRPRQRWALS